jgi:hypothetical protein
MTPILLLAAGVSRQPQWLIFSRDHPETTELLEIASIAHHDEISVIVAE